MKSARRKADKDQMRAEYDFSKGIRGKYARRFAAGTNVIVLDPDVAKIYKSSKKCEHLRALSKIAIPKSR